MESIGSKLGKGIQSEIELDILSSFHLTFRSGRVREVP